MVVGIEKFREYFSAYEGNYVVIGGTACDLLLDGAQLTPRATKDIDIILIIEALSSDFVQQFWRFIQDGDYGRKEIQSDNRQYYRFTQPAAEGFPYQLELFARMPDVLSIPDGSLLTPIPVDDDLSSLSAILLNTAYYTYTLAQSTVDGEVRRANTDALICLKAKAFLDMSERKSNGERVDEKNIRKHKNDVFRLAILLPTDTKSDLPPILKADMQLFTKVVETNLPDKIIFKEMGAGNINVDNLFSQLIQHFNLA